MEVPAKPKRAPRPMREYPVFPLWETVKRTDPRAVALADRHYSRKKYGTAGKSIGQNCRIRVLLHRTGLALWVAQWPYAGMEMHPYGHAWVCTLFRNEGAGLSSALVADAVACTHRLWGAVEEGGVPEGGFITFVDAREVRPKRDPGRCFLRAGFERLPGLTSKGLVALRLPRARVLELVELVNGGAPLYEGEGAGG
jgi:hypothetical protein